MTDNEKDEEKLRTVGDLIELLSKFDKNKILWVYDEENQDYGPHLLVKSVELDEDDDVVIYTE